MTKMSRWCARIFIAEGSVFSCELSGTREGATYVVSVLHRFVLCRSVK